MASPGVVSVPFVGRSFPAPWRVMGVGLVPLLCREIFTFLTRVEKNPSSNRVQVGERLATGDNQ